MSAAPMSPEAAAETAIAVVIAAAPFAAGSPAMREFILELGLAAMRRLATRPLRDLTVKAPPARDFAGMSQPRDE